MSFFKEKEYSFFQNDLQKAFNVFFDNNVDVEERVFRCFSIYCGSSKSRAKPPRPPHIWSGIESEIPLIHQLYMLTDSNVRRENETGFPIVQRRILTPDLYRDKKINWFETIKSIFGNSECCADIRSKIRASQHLGIKEIVLALLSYKTTDTEESQPFYHTKRIIISNLAKRRPYHKREKGWIEDFSENLIDKWNLLCKLEPTMGFQKYIIWHDGKAYKISPFTIFGGYRFDDKEKDIFQEQLYYYKGNVLEPFTYIIEEQISELEFLINSEAKESAFQQFFKKYPYFLKCLGPYQNIHSQIVIHQDSSRRLIPDFFLERLDTNYSDICDIKLPKKSLIRHQKNRIRFRDAVMEGIAQLDHYRNWFEDKKNRDAFHAKYGLKSYRPRAVLIIGRESSFEDNIQRITLESNLPNWIQLATYDDIIKRVKVWQQLKNQIEIV